MIQPKKNIERHPLEPFLPEGAEMLMLGSFPPARERWSMDFFYPNRQNDMWRIMGLIFFGNKEHFLLDGGKNFDRERIMKFCRHRGLALYDTAYEVRRLKDNASDKFLEVVTPTDIEKLIEMLPRCRAIVTTGQKATDLIVERFRCQEPAIGCCTTLQIASRKFSFWRMPSSSRAYPLGLERKSAIYHKMFAAEAFLP